MRISLTLTFIALTTAVHAASPDFSLTIYSSAAPGQISVESLANYNQTLPGYALVRDSRQMALQVGNGTLRFTDVAKRIDPTTVSFASLTDPDGTRVIEQNYQFDLVNQQKLLERYVGETVTVEQQRGEMLEKITGKLLSTAPGSLILQRESGEVVTLGTYSNVVFPNLPGGLITRPTLVWLVNAKQGGMHDTRVSYQTQGMTWWSDYNVTLREQGDNCTMDLSAWVTIVNQSGASYPSAQLKLVAGEVNRVPVDTGVVSGRMMKRAEALTVVGAAAGFQESTLSEYHLYTLGRRTELPDNSTKQLELFPVAMDVTCKKQLVFTAGPQPWGYWSYPLHDQNYGATTSGTVGSYLEFENKETNHMGMPLPAGKIRVNQANSQDGALEFIGEDVIKHTPRNETLRVKLGNAFDIVGERKQTNFVYNDSRDFIDETFEISVRNRKKIAVKVIVREYLYRWSKWDVTAKSHEFVKRDAQTIDFPLDIPADDEAKVTYTVHYSW